MGLGERPRAGEDHVRVARRLVHVDVHRQHELESLDRLLEAAAVRRGHHRVARHRDQRPHLALAGRVDLLGQACHRQLAERLAEPADPALPPAQAHAASLAGRAVGVALAGRGEREHRPALAVQVAREHVENVDQPARVRPELLGGRADAGVHGGVLGRRELAGHPPDLARGDAGGGRHILGRIAEHKLAELVEALAVLRQRPDVHQRLLDERARHGGEQERVAAGPDEVVLVGLVGGARPARVHHHDLAAALADPPQAAAHVGRGQEAAVRHQRVGAEHQQVVAAIQVRHGHAQQMAEHEPGRDLLGHLVHRAGREDVLRAERPEQHRVVGQEREVVGRRVPDVHGGGVPAVFLEDGGEAAVDLLEGLVPGGLAQLAVAPHERSGEPVGVLVELLEPVCLRADEPAAENVVAVTAHGGHAVAVEGYLQPAGGFAERTGPVVDALGHDERPIIHTGCMSTQGLTPGSSRAARSRGPATRRAAGRPRRRARTPSGAFARPPPVARPRSRDARPRARRSRSAP